MGRLEKLKRKLEKKKQESERNLAACNIGSNIGKKIRRFFKREKK